MRILVAGATGAIGLELVPQLIAAGHSVVGTTRTAAKAEIIKRMGAEPAITDGLDAPVWFEVPKSTESTGAGSGTHCAMTQS